MSAVAFMGQRANEALCRGFWRSASALPCAIGREDRRSNPIKPESWPFSASIVREQLIACRRNKVTAPDAQCVEEDFQARLASLEASGTDNPQRAGKVTQRSTAELNNKPRSKVIDKSMLALS